MNDIDSKDELLRQILYISSVNEDIRVQLRGDSPINDDALTDEFEAELRELLEDDDSDDSDREIRTDGGTGSSGTEHIDPETCPECGRETNKFVGECDHCGFDRWQRETDTEQTADPANDPDQ